MARGRILRCPSCRTYTLRDICPRCGEKTATPHPPPISPESPYTRLLLKVRRLKKG
ncbi:hypothetical protein HRbin01_00500 [archaeon HR01]|nr:hypothetical protein HRbin01_00500 [archaeon HR01]